MKLYCVSLEENRQGVDDIIDIFQDVECKVDPNILCDNNWNLYGCIEPEEQFFSLFLEGSGLQSFDGIYNIGINSEMVEKIMEDPNALLHEKKTYLECYFHLLVKAMDLVNERIFASHRIEITEKILANDQISEIWNDIQELLKFLSLSTGSAFPQDATEQIKFFMRYFSREWSELKNPSSHKIEDTEEKVFFFLLCAHDKIVLEDDVKIAYSRKIPGFSENHGNEGTNKEIFRILKSQEKRKKGIIAAKYFVTAGQSVVFDIKKLYGEDSYFLSGLVELYKENIISSKELIESIPPKVLDKMQNLKFSRTAKQQAQSEGRLIGHGIGASPYIASGHLIEAWDPADGIGDCIVVKERILPEDINWIQSVQGVITKTGSFTSHPSVIMRQLGKALICGYEDLSFDEDGFIFSGTKYYKGDIFSIDGESGEIYSGVIEQAGLEQWDELLRIIVDICKSTGKIKVYVNSENPEQMEKSFICGGTGIGLYRTEYMPSQQEIKQRILQYIADESFDKRSKILQEILNIMEREFTICFKAIGEHTAVIRTLDFPMHELLSSTDEALTVKDLQEYNPMLGNRGSRLSILHPHLFRVQIEAVCRAYQKTGRMATVKILLPMIADVREIIVLRKYINEVFSRNKIERGEIGLGSMIETPRALFCIDQIALETDFLSYGTNDLTQMVWGMSRDDSYKYLPEYLQRNIVSANPFVVFDTEGLLEPIKFSIEKARQANPKIEIGVCGEQISDVESLKKILELGIDYFSINPPKVLESIVTASLHRSNHIVNIDPKIS